MPRKAMALGALAAAVLAAGCGGSIRRISAKDYWHFKRHAIVVIENVDPETGEIIGNYWMGRSERPAFRVPKEEVEAFAKANRRIVEEAEAHARGAAEGYQAGQRTYSGVFTRQPRPPYPDAQRAAIYRHAWEQGFSYGYGASKAFPHQQ